MLRENKGVTLVALVITIIVLLILAGVSISMVVGDNGVLTQSTNAVDRTNEASAQSELESAISGVQADFMSQYYKDTRDYNSFQAYCTVKRIQDYLPDGYTAYKINSEGKADLSTSGTGDHEFVGAKDASKATIAIKYKGAYYGFIVNQTTNDTGATCKIIEAKTVETASESAAGGTPVTE